MNFLKLACFFVITILLHGSVDAQDWVAHKSQQQINDLVDTGSELLMATDVGLVVMNKTTLEKTIFDKSNSNLSHNHIQSITQDASGDVWIGTYDLGLAFFDGSDFQNPISPEGVSYDPLTTVLYDLKFAPNGDLWAATSAGVFHRTGQTWSLYDNAEFGIFFSEAWDIEIDNNGDVYVGGSYVYKFANSVWSNISDTTDMFGYFSELFISSAGDLYLAGDLDKIGRFDGQQWQEYEPTLTTAISASQIKFTEDTGGNIYLSTTQDGILKLVNDTWISQTDAELQAFDNRTSYLYIDDQDNRWLNYSIYLSVNKNGNVESTLISDITLETDEIAQVQKGDNGKMYFLTKSDYNISVLDTDGSWSFLPLPASATPIDFFYDILALSDNDIWLGSFTGLHHYTGGAWTSYSSLEPCRSFTVDSQGKIYVLGLSRIYIINNGAITEYNTNNSPISDFSLRGHGVDADDNLWVASSNGTDAMIQKVSASGSWTNYTKANYPLIANPQGDFHFDNEGNVWIPNFYPAEGVIKFDGTTFTNPILDNIAEQANVEIYSMEGDTDGKLYFSHSFGVTTLQDGVWESLPIAGVPVSFNASSIQFDDAGTLWWGSEAHGLFSYSTEVTTEVNLLLEAHHIEVFPNPTKNTFAIAGLTGDYTIQILDVTGAVYQTLSTASDQILVDITVLPAGMYFISAVNNANGLISVQKILKQ